MHPQTAQAPALQLHAGLQHQPVPKPHIILCTPQDVRDVDGVQEVNLREGGWTRVPPGHKVVMQGTALGPEDLDMVIMLVSTSQDTRIVGMNGQPTTRVVPFGEVARMDFQAFMALHEGRSLLG
jgi:hypothetical protein